jgi:hypothetical protein
MNFSKQFVKILSLFLCMTIGSTVFGNGEEKEKTPKNTREVKSVGLPKPTVATRASIVSATEGSVAPAQVQSELDAAVEKLQ